MVILNGWEVEVIVLLICENKIDIFVNYNVWYFFFIDIVSLFFSVFKLTIEVLGRFLFWKI